MSKSASATDRLRLVGPKEMHKADQTAVRRGISMERLVRCAGQAVADHIRRTNGGKIGRIAVLAGRGNNGKDAVEAARILAESGFDMVVFDIQQASFDIIESIRMQRGEIEAFDPGAFDLVLDGILGAGLSREVDGELANLIERVNDSTTPVVAIDVPSGIDGETGAVRGTAIRARTTITFLRRKPGHLLLPGRAHCGEVEVADIPIPDDVLAEALEGTAATYANEPALWRHHANAPAGAQHKYSRGHAVVFSGSATRSGAARMSATAALRAGAGLVTMLSPAGALMVNACHLTAVMLKRCEPDDLAGILEDRRLNAFALGPGFGIGERARAGARAVLEAGRRLVLDADGLTSFENDAEALFALAEAAAGTNGETALVLTPHDGEFARLFPDLAEAGLPKPERARRAASRAHAVVILKGADTVIAAPDGRAAINATGTPWLATAGTGDVLAGIVLAQLAQGIPAFEAAALGVWMHGRAAEHFGPGLIAEDLPGCLPAVHRELAAIAAERG